MGADTVVGSLGKLETHSPKLGSTTLKREIHMPSSTLKKKVKLTSGMPLVPETFEARSNGKCGAGGGGR